MYEKFGIDQLENEYARLDTGIKNNDYSKEQLLVILSKIAKINQRIDELLRKGRRKK